MLLKTSALLLTGLALFTSCQRHTISRQAVKPLYITEKLAHDSDDPAVWINPQDPAKSLIVGTDKDVEGGLYVFNLQGKIQQKIGGLKRPNNVDIEYGLMLNGKATDIAVTTERMTHQLRIFSLPDLKPVDNGGIEVFEGETQPEYRDLMGISMYKNKAGVIYAIVGRKTGPTTGGYLWQYRLDDDGRGQIKATLVRKFGAYSGLKEIESIVVDDKLGYVYYSDEGKGVRQYYADPEKGNEELALFATENFKVDHEGISIYELTDSTGYILVSDQGANRFQIFSREGTPDNPFEHKLVKIVDVRAMESDGSEMVSVPLNNDFKHGLFVVMSTDRTFHLYRWEDIAGKELTLRP
ncbi:phytase [Siphonobacter sp. SORGH_AS_1065]|uniref:phytase n=1 Tax=Siphonobacter sp. SORGH_AS_1065 TaxID=3041795 RepID=UPI00277F803A|nr:phytase [Siphonobacter sp. SORGH_AS_1065]MDQ1087304.1 3-phytase [Siphonobacter sp. SORGH_AS_1065]